MYSVFRIRALFAGAFAVSACGGRLGPPADGTGEDVMAESGAGASVRAAVAPLGSAAASTGGNAVAAENNDSSAPGSFTGPPGSTPEADCSGVTPPEVIRICSDGSQGFASYVIIGGTCALAYGCPSRPLGNCAPHAACTTPGTSCYVTSTSQDASSISCVCDGTGHFACSLLQPRPAPTGCAQGALCGTSPACSAGACTVAASACGWVNDAADGGCSGSCTCDATGHMACESTCDEDGGLPPECAGVTLPNYCDVCGDGTTGCAFFTTAQSSITGNTVCAIETCPPTRPGGIK